MPTPSLTIFTPRSYQTFQRSPANIGKVRIAGQLNDFTTAQDIDIRWDNGDWQPLQAGVTFRFDATVDKEAGQYSLDIRAGGYIASMAYVSVGDVYLVAGQSNAAGRGTTKQVYTHPTLKAGMVGMSYGWKELADWTNAPVVTPPAGALVDTLLIDGASPYAYGSQWPLLATLIMAETNVPVAFIVCAKGGTSITEWQPSIDPTDPSTIFGQMVRRIRWSGTIPKAMLWLQGETDAGNGMPADTYAEYLRSFVSGLRCALGEGYNLPVIAGKIIAMTKAKTPAGVEYSMPAIRLYAINRGIEQCQQLTAVVDLSDIAPDDAAGQHITSSAKLALAASRWWDVLKATFYS